MKQLVWVILTIWIAISGFMILSSQLTLTTGEEVLLKIAPVDPRDLLRGDYVILNYDISTIPNRNSEYLKTNETVYVKLKVGKNKIASFESLSKVKPKKGLFIKGKVKRNYRPLTVTYGIESYFVKEKTGRELERNLRSNAYAKVSIRKDGSAKVKELVLNRAF